MPSAAAGTIVFSHANGFPAGTYRVLFKAWLAAGYAVRAIEKFGHDPRYPVTSNWPHLRDQLIHFVERDVQGPAWLVGHSLGGILSLLAAAKRPDLARGVVMLDSPIPSGLMSGGLRLMKATGIGRRYSPSRVARKRRVDWPTAEAAFDHFSAKAAFAKFEPEVLRDYVRSGLEAHPHGQSLAFQREVEADIYDTLPHHIPGYLRRHPLRCPVAFVGGRRSREMRQMGLRGVQRVVQDRITWIDGSHLYPFEHPDEAAGAVLHWLREMAPRD